MRMRLAIAAHTGEMHRIVHAADAPRLDVVAGLIRPFIDTKALPAILKHLRHKRHSAQPAIFVERRLDLLRGADLHNVPYAKINPMVQTRSSHSPGFSFSEL